MFPGSARSRCYYKPPISSAPKPTMRSARTDAQLPIVFTHTAHEASPLVVCALRTAAAFTDPGSEASLVPELHVEASVPTSHTALHLPGFQPIRITMDLSPSRVSLAGRSLGCLRVQGMLVQCTVDSKHHVHSTNSSSVQVWQRNYWGSIEVLWRAGGRCLPAM